MEQIRSLWMTLDPRRRIVAVLASVAIFVAVLGLARMATAPGMALLYAGLEGAPAGEVIAALEQRNIAFEVRGDAIYVDASTRDETRMALAAQGLPASTASGYELLDGLTGFGTTSQMFDAAYWRAKEGELARTIMASPHVRHARVHIAHGATQPFRRERQVTASVTVTPQGTGLSAQQAQALRFLVASAVAGLDAANVSVIDGTSGQMIGAEGQGAEQAGDRAEMLRRNVERLLEARVGVGRAVVEVNVETVTQRETIVERLIDPATRTATSQETEERSAQSSDDGGQGVSVASNLPDGDAAATQGRRESREVSSRERTGWEVSQTSREVEREPGAIRRVTVAVLVDGVRTLNANGLSEWSPRPPEELEALRDLVASAVGFDEARGDVITLRSLELEPMMAGGVDGAAAGWAQALDINTLVRMAGLAAVILILSLFVLRPLLSARPAPEGLDGLAALGGPSGGGAERGALPALVGSVEPFDAQAVPLEPEPRVDPVERMRQLIADRQDETLEILRHWMEDSGEKR